MARTQSIHTPFEATLELDGDQPVVRVIGEVDVATSVELAACVSRAIEQAPQLILDLADTTFIDSTGLRVLVGTRNLLGRGNEGVVVRSPSPAVRRTLEISCIGEILTIEP